MPQLILICAILMELAFFSSLALAADAQAEIIHARSERVSESDKLRPGIAEKQVVFLIGDPEHKTIKDSSNSESWHYGNSLLFMQNGKLVAWSDSGEIKKIALSRQREREKVFKKTQRRKRESGWIDVWRPSPVLSTEDVLDDILSPRKDTLRVNID